MNRHLLSIAFILLSTAALVVGQLPDNTAPNVGITSPDLDSGVSAVVTVRATASDNVGVAGVQFQVDLENHGDEDTVAPFEVEWDTTLAASGAHTLSAVARDAAGNVAASELVVVVVCGASVQPCPTVQPAPPPPPPVNRPPVANGDSLASDSGAAVTFTSAFLLLNDTDPDNQPLTVTSVAGSSTQAGTVANNNNGSWTYTPRAGFAGTDTFSYVITDGSASATGSVTVTVTTPPPPPTSALVAHFTFDETDATQVTDLSGRGNHGVISGAQRVGGVSGGALQFDGVNDWVTIADAPSLDIVASFTLEAWVKPGAGGGYRTVVLKEATGFAPYELYANSDVSQPAAFFTTASGAVRSVTGTTALPTNSWTHLAATYDGANMRLYVNGSLVRTVARTGSPGASNGPLRIGGNQVWGGEFFAGAIDEVRVYNRALTATEVGADMTSTPPPAPVNRAPVAAQDSLATTTDSAVSFTSAFLLLNDSDPDGDPVTVASVAATSTRAGTIASTSPGSWTYTPAPGVSGDDSFTYVIGDGRGGSATGTVNVAVSGPAPPPPVGGGLVLAFGFNESAGATTTNDASGNGLAGSVREAQFVPGRYGNALSFDGINDWVTVADTTSSPLDLRNSMTIEAWVNPTTLAGWETVVMKERAGGLTYALYAHDGGTLAGGAAQPAGYNRIAADQAVRGTATLQTGEWTHLAFTYDGQNQRLYVNGELVRTRAQTGLNAQNNNALRIGGNSVAVTTFANEFFHGMIDEVRIYNRALSQSEIQTDMQTPVP